MPEKTSPEQRILLDGVELPPEMRVDVLDTVVSQHVEGGDAFQIRMNAADSTNQRLKWVDADKFAPGVGVEILFGYMGELTTVLIGEITALRLETPSDGPALLLVQGFDRMHRLRRGRRTRVFTEVKDSQVAERIAADLGLGSDVADTSVIHDYLLQNNLSDLDFLLDRARRIRYEVLVQDETLVFREAASHLGESATLEYKTDLMSFNARMTTVGQASEVMVRGWDPESKEALLGTGAAGDETSRMDGESLGAEVAESAFAAATTAVVDIPIVSQAEADQIAKARFNEMALAFVRGEATAVGNPGLRAGTTLRMNGLGERFSGVYYITKAEHRVGPQEGYVTRLCLERSAS